MKTTRFKSLNEERVLLGTMDEASGYLEEFGAFIAGGAVTSVFTNKEINDIDVYFPSEEALVRMISQIFQTKGTEKLRISDDLGAYDLIFNGSSQRTLLFKDKYTQQDIQFMTFKYFESPEEIFEAFDFTACMGAYDCAKKEFVLHEDFLKHNAQKHLKFNTGTEYPLMSLLRVDKYRKKGYNISKAELLRIVMTCMELKINDWDELKEHVGGMYGYDMSKIFDSESEFSMPSAIEQLNNIHDKGLAANWFPDKIEPSFEAICKLFVTVPEDYKPKEFDTPFKTGYLYKCTQSDYSPIFYPLEGIKNYVEGDFIDTNETGKIYFHADPFKPFQDSGYWVECELIRGETQQNACSTEKVLFDGIIKVTRTFEFTMNTQSMTKFEHYVTEKYLNGIKIKKTNEPVFKVAGLVTPPYPSPLGWPFSDDL